MALEAPPTTSTQNIKTLNFFFHLGRYLLFIKNMFSRPEKLSMYWKETTRQMIDIGIGSLVIVGLVSVFIGAVTAVQSVSYTHLTLPTTPYV